MKDLTLYYKSTCPFCQKVLHFMDTRSIDIPRRSIIDDPSALDELVRVGGKNQVPCLFIDGAAMYESDDIIEFLDKEFD